MCHTLISDCHQIINWLLLNERLAKLPKNIVLLWVYSTQITTCRVCLGSAYFAETENFLLKVL